MVACQKGRFCVVAISVSVLVILGWNCTLATCCPLVSHIDYAPCALSRLEKYGTDGRTPDALRLLRDAASRIGCY